MVRVVTSMSALAGLLLVGCTADLTDGPDTTAPAQTPAPAQRPAPAPAPAPAPSPAPEPAPDTGMAPPPPPGERPPIAIPDPDLDWPFDEDVERMAAFPALLDAAFDAGSAAGLDLLAQHSWPDGYTADAMLACRTSEPTPTYAELDTDGWRYRVDFIPTSPAPGFQYPPTGEYPADLGLRVYLGRLIVVTEERGEAVNTFDGIGRLAVRPDGSVVMFPMCFLFLPGQALEHRVTDGTIGGYTDAEAEGDIRLIFTSSPAEAQAEVCERLDARDIDALFLMIVMPDIESSETSIPRRVMERTVTELCASRVR